MLDRNVLAFWCVFEVYRRNVHPLTPAGRAEEKKLWSWHPTLRQRFHAHAAMTDRIQLQAELLLDHFHLAHVLHELCAKCVGTLETVELGHLFQVSLPFTGL